MANLVSPCHGKPLMASIVRDEEFGDTVRIWCMESTCHNTWDGTGASEDDYADK